MQSFRVQVRWDRGSSFSTGDIVKDNNVLIRLDLDDHLGWDGIYMEKEQSQLDQGSILISPSSCQTVWVFDA